MREYVCVCTPKGIQLCLREYNELSDGGGSGEGVEVGEEQCDDKWGKRCVCMCVCKCLE